jgi:hypothetical protein
MWSKRSTGPNGVHIRTQAQVENTGRARDLEVDDDPRAFADHVKGDGVSAAAPAKDLELRRWERPKRRDGAESPPAFGTEVDVRREPLRQLDPSTVARDVDQDLVG